MEEMEAERKTLKFTPSVSFPFSNLPQSLHPLFSFFLFEILSSFTKVKIINGKHNGEEKTKVGPKSRGEERGGKDQRRRGDTTYCRGRQLPEGKMNARTGLFPRPILPRFPFLLLWPPLHPFVEKNLERQSHGRTKYKAKRREIKGGDQLPPFLPS